MTCRTLIRLSVAKAACLKESGKYPDGGCLYLVVDGNRRSWTFGYGWRGGGGCEIGLGSARDLRLAKVREQAAE